MIGNIQNTNISNSVVYGNSEKNTNFFLAQKTVKDIFETRIKDEDKKDRKVGLIIAGSALLATAVTLLVTKRLPKNTSKRIENLAQTIEERVNKRIKKGKTGFLTSFYKYTLQKLTKFGEKANSINNVSSYKDLIFKRIMLKTKLTRRIHEKITRVFEKLARTTVNRKYTKSTNKFSQLFTSFDEINKKILSQDPNKMIKIGDVEKTASEWVKELEKYKNNVNSLLKDGFGKKATNVRYLKMKRANDGLDEKVYEVGKDGIKKLKKLKSSKLNQSFVAEEFLAADKIALNKEVSNLRNAISYTVMDNYKASRKILDDMSMIVNPKDMEANKLIRELKSNLSAYKKIAPNDDKVLATINSEISLKLKQLSQILKNSQYNEQAVNQILSSIGELEKLMSRNSKSGMQKILHIYEGLLPEQEYTKLLGKANSAVKTLDKAINTENDKFFDKLRDLKLGSGPTDVLSVIGAIGGVGIGLTRADNSEERKSAMLKYGIPVIGGVATSLFLTVSLVSAFKALAISSISSFIVGDLGVKIDKSRKLHNKKVEDNKHANAVKAEINARTA